MLEAWDLMQLPLFFKKIISNTPATIDQDHIKTLIYSNPKIPDRTKAIVERKESPVQAVVEGLKIFGKCEC